jgi:predicted secreted protein
LELSRFLVVIAIIVTPLACLASAALPESTALVITKADNGKDITVPEGAVIGVQLEQSAGTGYIWEIVDPDQTHLKVLESNDIPLKQGRIVGGPMLKTWQIKAVKKGQTQLKILLYRSWEGVEKAIDKLQVNITIS